MRPNTTPTIEHNSLRLKIALRATETGFVVSTLVRGTGEVLELAWYPCLARAEAALAFRRNEARYSDRQFALNGIKSYEN